MYADDTGILISNSCCEELKRTCKEVVHNTIKWFQASQLVLNMGKNKNSKLYSCDFVVFPTAYNICLISAC
jgi:hypothetical protein